MTFSISVEKVALVITVKMSVLLNIVIKVMEQPILDTNAGRQLS